LSVILDIILCECIKDRLIMSANTFPFSILDLAIDYCPGDPNKPTFVFVHGNTQNSSCGEGVIKFFSDRNHSTLCYDLPGHGRSSPAPEHYHFNDLIQLNADVISHYSLQSPILSGHSLGGMIQAAAVANDLVEARSLILYGSLDQNPLDAMQAFNQKQAESMAQYLDDYMTSGSVLFKRQKFYDYYANRHLDDAFLEIINRRYNQPHASNTNLSTLTGFSVREKLCQKQLPILVIHGESETVIPKPLVETMAKHYDNLQVEWLMGGGHNAFFQQAEQTDAILTRHYEQLI